MLIGIIVAIILAIIVGIGYGIHQLWAPTTNQSDVVAGGSAS